MRLAYLVGGYPAVSHTFILREVRGLRARGVEIETISIHRANPDQLLTEAEREEYAGTHSVLPPRWPELIRAHVLAAGRAPGRYISTFGLALRMGKPSLRGMLWQLFYFAEAMAVWRHCRSLGIRHLHAQFTSQVTDIALLIAHYEGSADPRWSWSFTVHGPDEFYEVSRFNLAAKVQRADFVVCISHFARSQLMALVPEQHWSKISIVRCGVDPAVFEPVRREAKADATEILCIGRLVAVKGQALVIEAVSTLSSRGLDARATIVGAGPTRDRLEALAAKLGVGDRIAFTGAVGQDRIRELYAAADVFCLPSFAEGVPVVLMEAMAMEVPVVTSRIMGIPELVEDGVNGLLIAPGDVAGLDAALERLARDPAERRRLGEAGRSKIVAEYALDTSVERLEQLFAANLPD